MASHVAASRGFTLIEIAMTLSVSSLLAMIVFSGQATVRSQFQFADSMARAKNHLNTIKNAANSTVNVDPGNPTPGANDGYIVFGKLARIDPGLTIDQIKVSTIKLKIDPAAAGPDITLVPEGSFNLPWGANFIGSHTQYIAFTRSPTDGHLSTVIPTLWPWDPTIPVNYAASAPSVDIGFSDPDGHLGHIRVESNGAITRGIP